MKEAHDPNRTADVPSGSADSLDAGLAAGFGPPRSSLGDLRPVLLKEAEGGAEQQAPRLGRLDADLALLRDLDAVDQSRWTVVENRLPGPAVVAARTRAALRRFGADPDAVSVDEVAARVSASVVRERIVAALDRLLRQEKKARVRAVLRRVDADPYRDAVRDAVRANDRQKMVELGGRKAALGQPPGFAAFLGESPALAVERRRQLLQAAVGQRPGDLGLLMTLAGTYFGQKDAADEELRWLQAAVAASPGNVAALNNMGVALKAKGQVDEAIACYRKAIQLDPKNPRAHFHLGNALSAGDKSAEAIACYQKAIALDPKFAEAHCGLGHDLASQGRFAVSLAALKRGHALGAKRPGWRFPSAMWVRGAELLVALEAKLPAVLKGELKPKDTRERLGLILVCQAKKLHRAAVRLYAAAFAAEPKLAEDRKVEHRYSAACHAALAAAGRGKDAAKLDDQERKGLRRQARDWLKADLAAWARLLDKGKPADRARVLRVLRHWQKDTDLAGLRDKEALAKLPAEEQKALAQLWAEVAALLKKARP
jgi:tetratricopeptide (TPR) repeat protein